MTTTVPRLQIRVGDVIRVPANRVCRAGAEVDLDAPGTADLTVAHVYHSWNTAVPMTTVHQSDGLSYRSIDTFDVVSRGEQ